MQSQQNYKHTTHRRDWENVLDELFITIVHFSKIGVAVISNTNRLHDNDGKGTVMPHLCFRIDNQQSNYAQQRFKRLSYKQFEHLFVLKRKLEPEAYDCYHVRQSEILKNKLLYFVEKDKKKPFWCFRCPCCIGN